MYHYTPYATYALALLLLATAPASCTRGGKDAFLYAVSRTGYDNTVSIDGFVEPVSATTLYTPRGSNAVVAFLVEDGTFVEKGEVVCVVESQELQNAYDQELLSLENARAQLDKTKADLALQYALLEAQVNNNEADTKIAQLDSLQLVYATPTQRRIKELELERALIEQRKYSKKLQALSVIQQSELRKLELNIARLTNNAKSLKDRIDALTIRAPQKGLALRAESEQIRDAKLQVGDVVWGNTPLVSIPELSQMKVKIMAPEADYKYISVNDSVSCTFDALPGVVAWGKITQKSPVGQQIKRDSKVKFFELTASIDSTTAQPEPGFTASCRITIRQVKDTIVIPQVAIFEEDLMKVVYVKQGNGYAMRQIQTGLSSPKEAIVVAGLQENDVISLVKPAKSMIKRKELLPGALTDSTTVAK